MHVQAMMDAAVKEFKQKLEAICQKAEAGELTVALASQVTRGLGEAAMSAARTGLKAFVESYDTGAPVVQRDGQILRRKLPSRREVMTPFGMIVVERGLYQADRGGPTYAPLDGQWGVEGEYGTLEVREACLFTLAHVTAEETAAILRKCAWFQPSATAIKFMGKRAGELIENREEAILALIREKEVVPEDARVVVASLDGTNVLLNEPGTRKGRPAERPRPEEPLDATTYRNAMVGCVSFYGDLPTHGDTPERLVSRYVARMPEDLAPTFKDRFEAEVAQSLRGANPTAERLLLCDGHRAIWNYAEKTPLFDGFLRLLDFHHASEHLSKAAEALFGKSSGEAKAWYDKWRHKLLHEADTAHSIVRSIDYLRKTRKIAAASRADLRQERVFFRRNKQRMWYAQARRRGLPIGSGPVEAACKSVVKQRLGRSGMRWSRTGGQHILHLRTLVKSERWEPFWKLYVAATSSGETVCVN